MAMLKSSAGDAKEFLFFDESGDPGPAGDPFYIVVVIHMTATVLNHVRYCDAAFRYHSQITKEYKEQNWGEELGAGWHAAPHCHGGLH